MTTIAIIGSICATLLVILNLTAAITLIVKKFRGGLKDFLKTSMGINEILEQQKIITDQFTQHNAQAAERDKSIAALKAGTLFCVKKELWAICDKVLKRRTLTLKEQEVLTEGQEIYTRLNGNGTTCEKIKRSLEQPIE